MEDKDRTLYCGNLSEKVTEDLLYELFLQAGPLEGVTIPKDKDGNRRPFGFISFKHAISVPYAVALMSDVTLFGRTLRLDARNKDSYNPYLEKLRDYVQRPRHDHWRHGPRRYEGPSRANVDNRYDNQNLPLPQQPVHAVYPVFNQPLMPMGNYPPTLNSPMVNYPPTLNSPMLLPYNQGMGMMPNSNWVRFMDLT